MCIIILCFFQDISDIISYVVFITHSTVVELGINMQVVLGSNPAQTELALGCLFHSDLKSIHQCENVLILSIHLFIL